MINALSIWSQHIPPTKKCFKHGKECTMKMPPLIHIEIPEKIEHENKSEKVGLKKENEKTGLDAKNEKNEHEDNDDGINATSCRCC